jgi:signal transduction histidine kinase
MDDLGAAVIHDVKNRLAELALLLGRRDDCSRETGVAMEAARQLTELLLAYRDEAGKLAANIDSASPAELAGELAEEYRTLFPGVDLNLEMGAAPAFWFYDEALIRLALGNALHNACRHAVSQVRLAVFKEDERLVVEIANDGPGYPPEMLAAGQQEMPHSRSGTGLGLHLARRIAALHVLNDQTGEVALANRDGACFRLILP